MNRRRQAKLEDEPDRNQNARVLNANLNYAGVNLLDNAALDAYEDNNRNLNVVAMHNLDNMLEGARIMGQNIDPNARGIDAGNAAINQVYHANDNWLDRVFRPAQRVNVPEKVQRQVFDGLVAVGQRRMTPEDFQKHITDIHREYGGFINEFNFELEPGTPLSRFYNIFKEKILTKANFAGDVAISTLPGAFNLVSGIKERDPATIIKSIYDIGKGGWGLLKTYYPNKIAKGAIWAGKKGLAGEEIQQLSSNAEKAAKLYAIYQKKNMAIMQSPLGLLFGLDIPSFLKMGKGAATALANFNKSRKEGFLRDSAYDLLKGWKKTNVHSLRDILSTLGVETSGIQGKELIQAANEAGMFGNVLPPDMLPSKYDPSLKSTENDDYIAIGQRGGLSSGTLGYGADVRMQRFYADNEVGTLIPSEVLSNGAFNRQAATQPQKFVFLTYEDKKLNSHYYDCKIPLKINIPSGDFGMYKVIINEVLFRNDAPLLEQTDWLNFHLDSLELVGTFNFGGDILFTLDSDPTQLHAIPVTQFDNLNTTINYSFINALSTGSVDWKIPCSNLSSLSLADLTVNNFAKVMNFLLQLPFPDNNSLTVRKYYYNGRSEDNHVIGLYFDSDQGDLGKTFPYEGKTYTIAAKLIFDFTLTLGSNISDFIHYGTRTDVGQGGYFYFAPNTKDTEVKLVLAESNIYINAPVTRAEAHLVSGKVTSSSGIGTIVTTHYYPSPNTSGKQAYLNSIVNGKAINVTTNDSTTYPAIEGNLSCSTLYKRILPKLMTQETIAIERIARGKANINLSQDFYGVVFPYISLGGPPLFMLNTTAQTTCPISNEYQKQYNVSSLSYNTSIDSLGIVQLMSNIELILKEGNDFRIWLTDNYGTYVKLQSPMYLQVTVVPFNNVTSESNVQ